MSPDYIVSFLYNIVDFFKKEKSQKFFIRKSFTRNDKTSTLKVIISPRGDRESPADLILKRRLFKGGYSCLYYYIPSTLLSSDIDETLNCFKIIHDQLTSEISNYKKQYNFERIDLISCSLGVVSACLIANGNDDVSNLYLIVPGSSLAASLWNGIRTQDLKDIYEKQGINYEQLKSIWKTVDPENNINYLKNKNIFIAISKVDKVIPYIYGKQFTDTVKNTYPLRTMVEENYFFGHYLTVLKYYIFSKVLLK